MTADVPVRSRVLSRLEPPAARRLRRATVRTTRAEAHDRAVRRRILVVWSCLFLNVLTFYDATWNGDPLLLPIPHRVGQLITQGALPVALAVALTINRRVFVRPNVFMCLCTMVVLEALVAALTQPSGHFVGTLYRTVRLATFVSTLWLLTPWWGRRDMVLLRAQLLALIAVLGSVVVGLVLAPGRALARSRLSGVVWPMPPNEVADFAAVTVGLLVVLWLCGLASRRVGLPIAGLAAVILVLTHARTELIGMIAGILIAGISLFPVYARVRRFFAGTGLAVSIGIVTLSGFLATWLQRGENGAQLSSLTGRTEVWGPLLAFPRDRFHELVGFGLSNKSFDGLPIDSNWLAAYWDLGLIGVALCVALLLFVLVNAYFQPGGPQRALALFVAVYLLVRSFVETGLTDASANLLELAMAASLVLPPLHARSTTPR